MYWIMKTKTIVTRGTIYLDGIPSRFQPAIEQALGPEAGEGELSFDISIDILRAILKRKSIYRVDYSLKKVVETKRQPASESWTGWVWSLFFSADGPAKTG